jgi:hypothetical protein
VGAVWHKGRGVEHMKEELADDCGFVAEHRMQRGVAAVEMGARTDDRCCNRGRWGMWV